MVVWHIPFWSCGLSVDQSSWLWVEELWSISTRVSNEEPVVDPFFDDNQRNLRSTNKNSRNHHLFENVNSVHYMLSISIFSIWPHQPHSEYSLDSSLNSPSFNDTPHIHLTKRWWWVFPQIIPYARQLFSWSEYLGNAQRYSTDL